MKDFVLMYCPSMESMANEIKDHNLSKEHCTVYPTRWDHFPDGYPNLFLHNSDSLAGKRIVLLLSFFNKEEIFEQLSGNEYIVTLQS